MSAGGLRAELIEDAGRAASSEEFFRSPEFCEAERVTHSLRIGELVAPLLVRAIEGSEQRDAISPYGYPGAAGGAGIDPGEVDWSATGLVSIFFRERATGEPAFTATSERGPLLVADPSEPRKSRMSDRQQIRRNLRDGFEVGQVPGSEASADDRAGFERAYRETMERTEAAERYFFSSEYFERILSSPRAQLFVVRSPDGEIAAGSIAVLSDGLLHYYLSGTSDAQLRAAPMKSLLASMTDFAEQSSVPLNLGGGLEPGDGLEEFKRGFANREESFRTAELVCDAGAYEELSAGTSAASSFFPAYRAP